MLYSNPGSLIPTIQLTNKPPKLATNETHTKDPEISLKKGITTFDERPQSIGRNAINNMIALTTCNPRLSTIFAKFIASSWIRCEAPSTLASTARQ